MSRETAVDSRQEILHTAGRLFQQQGYDATSMNDIAAALKLSKGGLYHHFQSKDEILFHIMSHAMDITEERVINRARGIPDPEERLRALIRFHFEVDREQLQNVLDQALESADRNGITGRELTPFLLTQMAQHSHGATLRANIALLENNASVAAEIAVALTAGV